MDTTMELGTSSVKLQLAGIEDVSAVWPFVEDVLRKHPRGIAAFGDPEDVHGWLLNGLYQLWIMFEEKEAKAVVLTSLDVYPKKKILHINWAGGEGLKEGLEISIETLRCFAEELGASEIKVHGRRGWVRALKPLGFDNEECTVTMVVRPKVVN